MSNSEISFMIVHKSMEGRKRCSGYMMLWMGGKEKTADE